MGKCKLKIIFADPLGSIPRFPNLGILYLISALRQKVQDIEIHYFETFISLDKQLAEIDKVKPDIYGISFASWFAEVAYQMINMIKTNFPNLTVVCGGPHPTADPKGVLTESKADICVIGEGEETIVELVKCFLDGGKLEKIAGIAYKKDEQIKRTPPRSFIKNLDSINFPAWDVINIKNYLGRTLKKAHPQGTMTISRGCPFNCNYCANPVWKSNRPWYRVRSPENIAEEIELQYIKMGVREIMLWCDEFNANLDWSIDVCREIENLQHQNLYFQTVMRVDKVPKELAKHLYLSNCWMVYLGIESGNQRTLDGLRKQYTVEQIVNACKILKEAGVKTFGFFMIYNVWEENGKLCYESHQDVKNTLEFAKWLSSKKLLDFNAWGYAVPIPGSELYDICLRHNLITSENRLTSSYSKWKGPPIRIPKLDGKVMEFLKRKGNYLQIRQALHGLRYINIRDYKYLLTRLKMIFKTR